MGEIRPNNSTLLGLNVLREEKAHKTKARGKKFFSNFFGVGFREKTLFAQRLGRKRKGNRAGARKGLGLSKKKIFN